MTIAREHLAAEPSGRDFPCRDTPAAELIARLQQRYETTGAFDEATVFEILGRFMVTEGLATDTGRYEGPYYVEDF